MAVPKNPHVSVLKSGGSRRHNHAPKPKSGKLKEQLSRAFRADSTPDRRVSAFKGPELGCQSVPEGGTLQLSFESEIYA